MSNLYGTLSGDRKDVTKCGNSRLNTHIRGWEVGVYVAGTHDENKQDTFEIYATYGSNRGGNDILIGEVTLVNGEPTFKYL